MPENRVMVGFSTKGDLPSRIDEFANEYELSRGAAVRMLVRMALDAQDRRKEREKTRQGKGPAA